MAHARGRGCALLLVLIAGACGFETKDIKTTEHPAAGLYTPGTTLGASDPTDMPSLGNRCVSLPASAAPSTAGTLTLEFTTQTLMRRYHPKNVTATWVENEAGQFVDTLELSAGIRRTELVYFQERACVDKFGADTVTTATLPNHEITHEVAWNAHDFEDKPIPDGKYKLYIELTESDEDEPGEYATFEFEKGPIAFGPRMEAVPDGPLKTVTLGWMPAAGGSAGAAGGP